jgi:hypothetical protein
LSDDGGFNDVGCELEYRALLMLRVALCVRRSQLTDWLPDIFAASQN